MIVNIDDGDKNTTQPRDAQNLLMVIYRCGMPLQQQHITIVVTDELRICS
jgi:hypothetical protein